LFSTFQVRGLFRFRRICRVVRHFTSWRRIDCLNNSNIINIIENNTFNNIFFSFSRIIFIEKSIKESTTTTQLIPICDYFWLWHAHKQQTASTNSFIFPSTHLTLEPSDNSIWHNSTSITFFYFLRFLFAIFVVHSEILFFVPLNEMLKILLLCWFELASKNEEKI